MRKCHIWEISYSRDLYSKALDQSDQSIFQIAISFEPFNRFLYFFAYRYNTIRRLRILCHFSIKMPFCPEKGQKGAKVGGAVGKNQLFCILFKIGPLDFFHILHKVREH